MSGWAFPLEPNNPHGLPNATSSNSDALSTMTSLERALSKSSTSLSSAISSPTSEDKGIDFVLNSLDRWSGSDSESILTNDVQDLKWQEFSPPKELYQFAERCSPEIGFIVKESLMGQWQATRVAREQSPIPEESSSKISVRHSRRTSIDFPMLAAELSQSGPNSSQIGRAVGDSPQPQLENQSTPGSQPSVPFASSNYGSVGHEIGDRDKGITQAPPPHHEPSQYQWMGPDSFGVSTTIGASGHSRSASTTSSLRSKTSALRPNLLPDRLRPISQESLPLQRATMTKPVGSWTKSVKKKKKDKNAMGKTYVDKYNFPPACCGLLISLKLIQSHLDSAQRATYKEKEKATADNPREQVSLCPSCSNAAHPEGLPCPQQPARSPPQPPLTTTHERQLSNCEACLNYQCSCVSLDSRENIAFSVSPQPSGSPRPSSEVFANNFAPLLPSDEQAQAAAERYWESERREESRQRYAHVLKKLDSKFAMLDHELNGIHDRQMAEMDRRHEDESRTLQEGHTSAKMEIDLQISEVDEDAAVKITEKTKTLREAHEQALTELKERQQEEEDDTLLTITRAYRSKPDKEARISAMLEKVAKLQVEEREQTLEEQRSNLDKLIASVQIEASETKRNLIATSRLQKSQANKQGMMQMKRFWADGEWFSAVVDRRHQMIQAEHNKQADEILTAN
ncbi:MAG: hypothetical protein M1814_005443 [Vezdaea aestivalis]|nr:MAG: hypothetical protein M1814_005443 [Vezdaea aestivalis]